MVFFLRSNLGEANRVFLYSRLHSCFLSESIASAIEIVWTVVYWHLAWRMREILNRALADFYKPHTQYLQVRVGTLAWLPSLWLSWHSLLQCLLCMTHARNLRFQLHCCPNCGPGMTACKLNIKGRTKPLFYVF